MRNQLSLLNDFQFSDREWSDFLNNFIFQLGDGKKGRIEKIQKGELYELKDENDRIIKNVRLVNKRELSKNKLQFICQDERNEVIIFINGLPFVLISIFEFNSPLQSSFQAWKIINSLIDDEKFKKFSDYLHLFVWTNAKETRYCSITTWDNLKEKRKSVRGLSNSSFKSLMRWSDSENNKIDYIEDFATHFLNKNALLNVICKFCVFRSNSDLWVMRPYQICATERILEKIKEDNRNSKNSKNASKGGCIWHSTGSGKTLTSFKAVQLASEIDFVDKVLFVVDRKDLDNQTIEEYEKFQAGSVSETENTNDLKEKILDDSTATRAIVTTIHKLKRLIDQRSKLKDEDLKKKNIVLIFDECHRSQFGKMKQEIDEFF
nr:DEAD/DEAH box helicase family protein [Mycoplasmoides pneumoniae]